MSKDIFDAYPSSKSQGGQRISGVNATAQAPKPLPYSPPLGPKNQTKGPGLGANNLGNKGTQGKR